MNRVGGGGECPREWGEGGGGEVGGGLVFDFYYGGGW